MKKYISMLLSFLLLILCINTAVFSGVLTELIIDATEPYNKVEGEGFHDEGSYTIKGFEQLLGGACLRFGDWVTYDVSSLAAGRYKMSLNYASRNVIPLSVYVDDVLKLESSVAVTNSDGWNADSFRDAEFGIVELSGKQKKLKVLNTSTSNLVTISLKTIKLTRIDDLKVESVSGNASNDGDVFARGTDVFTITMNKAIEPASYSSGDVVLEDALGNEISSDVSISGATITIKLKETLCYGEEYKICFSDDLEGTENEKFAQEGFEYAFLAADDSNQDGLATIAVSSYEAEKGTISASGYVKSSAGLGIKGREVKLSGQNKTDSEATFEVSVISGDDGAFEISYKVYENANAGDYDVEITSDYVETPYSALLPYQDSFSPSYFKTKTTEICGINVLEGGHETGFFDTSGSNALEQSGDDAIVLRQNEWSAYDTSSLETGYYEISVLALSSAETALKMTIGEKTYGVSLPKSDESFKTTIVAKVVLEAGTAVKLLNESDSCLTIRKIRFEKTVSHDAMIQTNDVIPGGQGVGYYDNGLREDHKDVIEGTSLVCYRQSEWTAHDISSLSAGTYLLSLKRASTKDAIINLSIDSEMLFKNFVISATGAYGTYLNAFLGVIHIDEDDKVLKLENASATAFYADYLTLSKVSDEKILNPEYKFNSKDVYSKILNEGYYDKAGYEFTNTNVYKTDHVILHSSDWFAYGLADVRKNRVYDIVACVSSASGTTFDVMLDGKTVLSSKIDSTGSGDNFEMISLGKVFLNDSEKLTIKNSGSSTARMKYFNLVRSYDSSDFKLSTINPTDVIPGGDGVGYYDNPNLSNTSGGKLELSDGGIVIFREAEWLKYDVSDMISGDYLVYADFSNRMAATIEVSTDSSDDSITQMIAASGEDYSTYRNNLIGKITITDETEIVTIKNAASAAMMIKSFSFELIPFKEEIKITKDAEGEIEADVLLGNDRLYVTGDFQNSFYLNDGIRVLSAFYAESGRLLSVSTEFIKTPLGQTTSLSVPVDVDSTAAKLKILLWKNIDGFEPVTTEKIIYAGWDSHYYVDAENGNDAESGESEEEALKTLSAAQALIREKNDDMYGDIYVHLSGEFKLDETMVMTPEDSGTNGFSVIYSGDGNASISGGEKISGFNKVEGTPLYKTTVSNADFRQLYVNGNRAQRARSKWLYLPKEAYYPETEEDTTATAEPEETETVNPIGYILDGNDFPEDFSSPSDMEMVWLPSWRNVRVPLESMTRLESGDLKVEYPDIPFDAMFTSSAPVTENHYFYIENAPEFLDEPGEWYCNNEGELFYYPLETDDMENAEVFIPRTEKLLSIGGTDDERIENITFKGIEFKYGAWNRTTEIGFSTVQAEVIRDVERYDAETKTYPSMMLPAQICVDYGKNINFLDNKFIHLGSVGLSFDNKTEHSKIEGNLFDDTSAAAITVSNGIMPKNSPKDEFCRYIDIKNNLIRRVSVEYMTPAITAYYVHHTSISNNDLKDCPYTGISLGWGWNPNEKNITDNTVANNRIDNVLYKLRDGGHIYTLSRAEDSVIENNYMIKSGSWKGGVYLDNGSSNYIIRNNVIEAVDRWVKLTYTNLSGNITYDNYSDSIHGVVPDRLVDNSITEAIQKTDGEWPDGAKAIIANAGLSSDYKHLLTDYEQNTHYRNAEVQRMPYIAKNGITFQAGELIPGGEGVAYHDLTETDDNTMKGPGKSYSYDGSGRVFIQNTKEGEWTKHPIEIPESGTYKIYINSSTRENVKNIKASLWLDEVKIVDGGTIENTGGYNNAMDQDMGTFSIEKGSYVLKLEYTSKNFIFYSLRFVKVEDDSKPFERNDGFNESIYSAIID